MGVYLTLLLVSAFLSISVYEGLVILGMLFILLQRKVEKRGSLFFPLIGFAGITVASTAIYFPRMLIKSLSEGLFQLIYLFSIEKVEARKTLSKVPYLLTFLGILGIPLLIYNEVKTDSYKIFWGGVFETAQFYTIFLFAAFLIAVRDIKANKNISREALFYIFLSTIFLLIVVFSHRRSYLLATPVVFLLILLLLYRNRLISSRFVIFSLTALLLTGSVAYAYLSTKDIRFKTLNEVILGKKKLDAKTLNIISSSRYNIMLDGINIIAKDLEEGRYLNLLIGHGIRSGLYLPHEKSPKNWERYESIILISELIERGVLGLASIIFIYILAFKKFLSMKLSDKDEIIYLIAFIPLLMHLIASVFTFFWDALLPLYLLMFKFGEKACR